jgi:hypothetical protein
VHLADDRYGWLSPEETANWIPYGDVVRNRLNYLTTEWTGHVWPGPGAGIPWRSAMRWSDPRGEFPATVLETTLVGGTLWLRVEVYAESPCESGGDPRVDGVGWIPSSGANGDPTAWFYSRGC